MVGLILYRRVHYLAYTQMAKAGSGHHDVLGGIDSSKMTGSDQMNHVSHFTGIMQEKTYTKPWQHVDTVIPQLKRRLSLVTREWVRLKVAVRT